MVEKPRHTSTSDSNGAKRVTDHSFVNRSEKNERFRLSQCVQVWSCSISFKTDPRQATRSFRSEFVCETRHFADAP